MCRHSEYGYVLDCGCRTVADNHMLDAALVLCKDSCADWCLSIPPWCLVEDRIGVGLV